MKTCMLLVVLSSSLCAAADVAEPHGRLAPQKEAKQSGTLRLKGFLYSQGASVPPRLDVFATSYRKDGSFTRTVAGDVVVLDHQRINGGEIEVTVVVSAQEAKEIASAQRQQHEFTFQATPPPGEFRAIGWTIGTTSGTKP